MTLLTLRKPPCLRRVDAGDRICLGQGLLSQSGVEKNERTWLNGLEIHLTEKFRELLNASKAVSDDSAALKEWDADLQRREAELQERDRAFNALFDIVANNGDDDDDNDEIDQKVVDPVVEEKVCRRVTYNLANEDTVCALASELQTKMQNEKKAAAQAKSVQDKKQFELDNAEVKRELRNIDAFYKSVEYFHFGEEEDRRAILATKDRKLGPVFVLGEPKYSPSDVEFKNYGKENYLAGYADSTTARELQKAINLGLDVPEGRVAFLKNREDKKHPFQVGKRIGDVLSWRVLCHQVGRPDWDHSLSTRRWTELAQFWSVVKDSEEDDVFAGIHEGYSLAEAKMDAKLEAADKFTQFETVTSRTGSKPAAPTEEASSKKSGDTAQTAGSKVKSSKPRHAFAKCDHCGDTGHIQRNCPDKAKPGNNKTAKKPARARGEASSEPKSQGHDKKQTKLASLTPEPAKKPAHQQQKQHVALTAETERSDNPAPPVTQRRAPSPHRDFGSGFNFENSGRESQEQYEPVVEYEQAPGCILDPSEMARGARRGFQPSFGSPFGRPEGERLEPRSHAPLSFASLHGPENRGHGWGLGPASAFRGPAFAPPAYGNRHQPAVPYYAPELPRRSAYIAPPPDRRGYNRYGGYGENDGWGREARPAPRKNNNGW
ncbi:hypothetical protein SLS59_000298 [Nothophoma quercina]|uniref:CCHC-type domain-containing protein n=1 Tax=Nothophoma quercina TaxID=749835 RepID=A0ABR3S5P3_9PLEO